MDTTNVRQDRTSLQTKSSSGSVVNMFSPKQKRATLMSVSFWFHLSTPVTVMRTDEHTPAKLFSIFPCVLSVNTT